MKVDSRGYLRSRGKLVHRIVWEKVHGPVPPGWDVHHIDGDKLNNDYVNLVALPHRVHFWVHEQQYTLRKRMDRKTLMDLYETNLSQWKFYLEHNSDSKFLAEWAMGSLKEPKDRARWKSEWAMFNAKKAPVPDPVPTLRPRINYESRHVVEKTVAPAELEHRRRAAEQRRQRAQKLREAERQRDEERTAQYFAKKAGTATTPNKEPKPRQSFRQKIIRKYRHVLAEISSLRALDAWVRGLKRKERHVLQPLIDKRRAALKCPTSAA